MRRMPRPFISIGVLLLFLFASLPCPEPLWAQEARLQDLRISNRGKDFVLYLKVEGAFTEEMKNAVMSGVPATFSFYVILNQVRRFWLDRTVADIVLTHTVEYQTLRNAFVVRRSWEENRPILVSSFEDARRLMTEIDNIPLIPLSMLDREGQYQLRAKAELGKITLPLYLHYLLFFVSLWDFETDWYTIDFTY